MNKKEEAAFKALADERDKFKALRWTPKIEPDVPKPATSLPFGALSKGWRCHNHDLNFRLHKGISSCGSHAVTDTYNDWPKKTDSQRPIDLFSSPSLALRAARHEIAERCAEVLARIDREIDKAEANDAG